MLARFRPSPAMVVACLALVVALGGSAYAVSALPKNSVGTKQIKNSAVKTAKIKDGAVTNLKIKDGSVTAPKIKNGAITSGKLAPLGRWIPADLSVVGPSSCGPSSQYRAFGNGYAIPGYRLDAGG